MNFKKARNTQQKTKTFDIPAVASKSSKNEILLAIIIGIVIIGFGICFKQISDTDTAVTSEETMGPVSITVTDNTTSTTTPVTTTTTTAKAVTTSKATSIVTVTSKVTVLVTEDVPATERSVAEEPVNEPEPSPVQIEVPEPEVYQEPIVQEPEIVQEEPPAEEPQPIVNETPTQEFYSDDGDYGWSHVSYRYGTPDLTADQARYHTANEYVSEEDRILLINIVASEYGSDWVSVSEKAKIVAVVMNRLANGYWGNSIRSVLTYSGQFDGYTAQSWFYRSTTPTCIDAVDYYFLHKDESQYQGIMYISGHGSYNSFW